MIRSCLLKASCQLHTSANNVYNVDCMICYEEQYIIRLPSNVTSAGLSDEILAIVEKRKMPRSELSGLTIRPGYTFGLGCNKWEASSHSGTIDGWNSEPMIRW